MGNYQLNVFKENNRVLDIYFKDASGTAVNITDYTIRFTVKQRFDNSTTDASALILKNVTAHTDAAAGHTRVELSKTDTNISPGTYVYDWKYIDASGNEVTVVQDEFVVHKVVTNR